MPLGRLAEVERSDLGADGFIPGMSARRADPFFSYTAMQRQSLLSRSLLSRFTPSAHHAGPLSFYSSRLRPSVIAMTLGGLDDTSRPVHSALTTHSALEPDRMPNPMTKSLNILDHRIHFGHAVYRMHHPASPS